MTFGVVCFAFITFFVVSSALLIFVGVGSYIEEQRERENA